MVKARLVTVRPSAESEELRHRPERSSTSMSAGNGDGARRRNVDPAAGAGVSAGARAGNGAGAAPGQMAPGIDAEGGNGPMDAKYKVFVKFVADAVKFRRSKLTVNAQEDGRIPWGTKLPYALPQFSLTSLTMLIGIHGTLFYTKVGADVAFIAFFTALARSFDVVTDPVMGYFSDKTRTKHGRRRPYMLGACPFYALCFILLFSPPAFESSTSVAIWFGVFYIIFYLFDTIGNVPYSALGPELSDVASERDSLFFWAKLFNGIGILIGAVGPVALAGLLRSSTAECTCEDDCPFGPDVAAQRGVVWNTTAWGSFNSSWYNATACGPASLDTLPLKIQTWCGCYNDCDGACDVAVSRTSFSTIAWVFGLYYVASMVLCVWRVKERKFSQLSSEEGAPLVPSLLATLRNKPFMGLLPAWVCDMTAYTMIGTMLPFYVEYVIVPGSVPECADGKRAAFGLDPVDPASESEAWCKSDTWLGFGLVMLIGAQICAMPIWLKLTKTFGKFKTWLAFNLTTAVTNGMFVIIGRGDPKLCMMLAILNGMPSGAQFLTDSIVADVIDYDEFLTGERAEGRFTIFQTFIPKIVSVPAQAVPLALLSFFGFVAPIKGVSQEQPEGVKLFIMFIFFVLPCFLAICSFFIKMRFPIKTAELSEQIVKGAALHLKGEVAQDPLTGQYVGLFQHRNEEEKKVVWQLDNFFKSQLKLLLEDPASGTIVLARQLKRTVWTCVSLASVSLIVTTVSIATGLLTNESWSWLPAFSVIGFGMSVSAVVFNYVRYKAALTLMANPPPQELVNRWYLHLEGTDDAPLTSMVHVKSQHDMLVKKMSQASMGRTPVARVPSGMTFDDGGVQMGTITPAPNADAATKASALPHQVSDD